MAREDVMPPGKGRDKNRSCSVGGLKPKEKKELVKAVTQPSRLPKVRIATVDAVELGPNPDTETPRDYMRKHRMKLQELEDIQRYGFAMPAWDDEEEEDA